MGTLSGWFHEHALLFILLIAAVIIFCWLNHVKERLNTTTGGVLVITALFMIWGLMWLRLFAIIEVLGDVDKAANMRLYGALFFDPIAFAAVAKKLKVKAAEAFDIFSIGLIISLFCGRINCFVAGCCYGTLVSIHGAQYRWPIREWELIFYVLFLLIYWKKVNDKKTHGEVYPVLMISYGAFRFIIEWLRVEFDSVGIFHLAHIWSLLSLVLGLCIYFKVTRRQQG